MQIIIGCILLIVAIGMLIVARPPAGRDSVLWLSKPWILGQVYVLATLVVAVVGVSFVFSGLPS